MTTNDIVLRPARPTDLESCGRIIFEAFGGINSRHGFPSDFPTPELAAGVATMALSHPAVFGVIAERSGDMIGSNFLWDLGVIAGIGPITVDPSAQNRNVGRRLMEEVLARAKKRQFASVRLVQSAFNTKSMSLYTKLGFDIREPLVCMQGEPPRATVGGFDVRSATETDIPACNELCYGIHGHDREAELRAGVAQNTALVAIHDGAIVGYASDVGYFGHAVARSNPGLIALIGAAPRISGPGFLLPSRNGEVFRWCLNHGLKFIQPLSLMSLGLYNEPRGAFLPSILF